MCGSTPFLVFSVVLACCMHSSCMITACGPCCLVSQLQDCRAQLHVFWRKSGRVVWKLNSSETQGQQPVALKSGSKSTTMQTSTPVVIAWWYLSSVLLENRFRAWAFDVVKAVESCLISLSLFFAQHPICHPLVLYVDRCLPCTTSDYLTCGRLPWRIS